MPSIRARARSVLVLAALAACDGTDCFQLPCAPPIALAITVTSSVSGTVVPNATVTVRRPDLGEVSCAGSCSVPGTAGAYEIGVQAPGYQGAQRSVRVLGTDAGRCGCATVETERVAIALMPVT